MSIEKNITTVSVTMHGSTVTITEPRSDYDIYEWLDILQRLTVAIGYPEKIWKEGIINLSSEYEENM